MEYFIIIYKNTFDAMEAERIFNEKGFKFKIMPTPNFNNSKLWNMYKI